MSESPDNQIRTALVEYEKQRGGIPFANFVEENEQFIISVNFSPYNQGIQGSRILKLEISKKSDPDEVKDKIKFFVSFVLEKIFLVNYQVVSSLEDLIASTEGGFTEVWKDETKREKMSDSMKVLFNVSGENDLTKIHQFTQSHIMCHDFNSFAISVSKLLMAINPESSRINGFNDITNVITTYLMYKGGSGITANTFVPKKIFSQTPHEQFVVPTLKLMIWMKKLVENIDKYIPVVEEA